MAPAHGAHTCAPQGHRQPPQAPTNLVAGTRERLLRLPLAGQPLGAVGARLLHQLLIVVVRDQRQRTAGRQQHRHGGQQARQRAARHGRGLLVGGGAGRHRQGADAAGRARRGGHEGLRHSGGGEGLHRGCGRKERGG